MDRVVWYEQPLNERYRMLLRLEFLFARVHHAAAGWAIWDSRSALEILIELLSQVGRAEVRTEISKELERLTSLVARTSSGHEDNEEIMSRLPDLVHAGSALFDIDSRQIEDIRRNGFLSNLRQRTSIPGGSCSFDLPALHYWLNRDAEIRHEQLDAWLHVLEPIATATRMILEVMRGSTPAVHEIAQSGFYQQTLDTSGPLVQLVRIGLHAEADAFAEISGGRHRYSVRFLRQPSPVKRPFQTEEDIGFLLACCAR